MNLPNKIITAGQFREHDIVVNNVNTARLQNRLRINLNDTARVSGIQRFEQFLRMRNLYNNEEAKIRGKINTNIWREHFAEFPSNLHSYHDFRKNSLYFLELYKTEKTEKLSSKFLEKKKLFHYTV